VGSADGIRVNSLAMDTLRTLFEQYGLLLVFGAVLVEQIGPPLPSGPLLIVAGALATEGRLSAWPVAAMAWGAGMLGKVALYVVGGRYGRQVMQSLCRMAVTPDSSIAKTNGHFERWGAPLLVVAEFIPGVRTLAPSLAGAENVRTIPFLLYSALGAALWTALYVGIGLVFHEQIDRAVASIEQTGKIAAVVAATAVAAYFAVKWWRRRRSTKA
jgi:membrane protein DedA with SNARE-associated domain